MPPDFSILRTLPSFLLSINLEHIKAIISSGQWLIFILTRFVALLFLNPPSGLFLSPLSFKPERERNVRLGKSFTRPVLSLEAF